MTQLALAGGAALAAASLALGIVRAIRPCPCAMGVAAGMAGVIDAVAWMGLP